MTTAKSNVYQHKMRKLCMRHQNTVYFYMNLPENDWYIEQNTILPETLQNTDCNVLEKLAYGEYISQEDYAAYQLFYQQIVEGIRDAFFKDEMTVDFHCKTAQENYELVRLTCFMERNEQNRIQEITGEFRVLTEKEKIERKILSQYSSDRNPTLFLNRVEKLINQDSKREYAFIQFDVDNFKLINDSYGIETGDAVLQAIYNSLQILCKEGQVYTRMSSDQFVLVMACQNREEVVAFIQMIDKKITHYRNIPFRMTYGVSFSSNRKQLVRSYLDEAEFARRSIKGNMLENIAFYDDRLKLQLKSRNEIELIEEAALENGEFVMYLQPKYDFSIEKPAIIGAEALVRWNHPEKGIIPPAQFVPLFEQNGFILKVDEFIWEYACQTIARWMQEGKKPIPISINISRAYIQKIDIVSYISDLLVKYKVPIELLQLEITETMENKDTAKIVEKFKQAGFTMLMDDFGSGYSSLNMLKNTKFDVLKIDQGFLSEFLDSGRGKSIVSHVISMSDELGLDTIAEGVETKEQAEFLQQNGCRVAQGFYFSKPLPVKEFENLAFARLE